MVIFPLRGSGSGVYVDKLSQQLANQGHQVKVLCADHYPPRQSYPTEAILFSNGENQAFDLDFNFPAFTSHPLSPQRTFGNLTESQNLAYRQVFRERIVKELTLFKPDIVHVHHGWVIASVLAELDTPYVISLHGTEHLGFHKYPDYQALALAGLRRARMIMALSEESREQALRTYGIDPEKIVIITTGVDTQAFKAIGVGKSQVLDRYAIHDASRPVVLFAGKLTAIKGVDVLLKAAQIYAVMDEGPITLIAGDGDLRGSLEAFAQELRLNSVHFLGNQTHEQMVGLYNIADVVAFPSTTDYFPLVALEALACGTPIVASRVGGFRQMVVEQVGYLIPPGDHAALAEKITAAIRGRFKAKASHAAVAHIRQNFSLEKMVGNIEKVYDAALARPHAHRKQV